MENTSEISLGDLMKKKSVRATFKLSEEVIDLLGVISSQLGIQQKSLLDQLTEDKKVLNKLASSIEGTADKRRKKTRQKTFVISRNTLNSINSVAKDRKIPRDALVEITIKRLRPLIDIELKKHQNRKVLLQDLRHHLHMGQEILKKADNLLGRDDPLYEMIAKQLSMTRRNVVELDTIVAKGEAMEAW